MSSRPFSRQWRRNSCVAGSSWITNASCESLGRRKARSVSRSTVSSQAGPSFALRINSRAFSSGMITGTSPFSKQFLWKISAKPGLITARKPYCRSAQTACSREEPLPKLRTGYENAGVFVAGLVENEVRVRFAVRPVVASRKRESHPSPGALSA